MLDVRRLMLLREVKLHGSMTSAARELAYSHSAVSQQLAALEREAGVKLLERVGRNVKLTAAGEELVRNTEPILAALERAESDLSAAHESARGVVTVAAFATVSRVVMPAVLSVLARDFPGLDVRLRLYDPEEAAVRLASRQVDAVVTDAYPGTEGVPEGAIHSVELARDPVRPYLPAEVTDDADGLRHVRWVMEPPTAASRAWALRVCRESGFEPVVAHESSDLLFHRRLVEAGLAAAFLPELLMRETGTALRPSAALPSSYRSILFLTREGSQNRPQLVAVREVTEQVLKAQLGDM